MKFFKEPDLTMWGKIVDYHKSKNKSPSMKKSRQMPSPSNEKKSTQVKQRKDAQWSFLNSIQSNLCVMM